MGSDQDTRDFENTFKTVHMMKMIPKVLGQNSHYLILHDANKPDPDCCSHIVPMRKKRSHKHPLHATNYPKGTKRYLHSFRIAKEHSGGKIASSPHYYSYVFGSSLL